MGGGWEVDEMYGTACEYLVGAQGFWVMAVLLRFQKVNFPTCWALKVAAASYGIVTEFRVQTFSATGNDQIRTGVEPV